MWPYWINLNSDFSVSLFYYSVYTAAYFPQFLQKRKVFLILQIAYNKLKRPGWFWFNVCDAEGKCGSIWYPAHWVKLENGVTAPKFSIPLKNYPFCSSVTAAAAMPLFYLCWSVELHKSFPQVFPMCLLSSASQHRIPLAMLPVYLQQLPKCHKQSLTLIWENPG